jgi:hypothetical protein
MGVLPRKWGGISFFFPENFIYLEKEWEECKQEETPAKLEPVLSPVYSSIHFILKLIIN